jgi:hypothetical protein
VTEPLVFIAHSQADEAETEQLLAHLNVLRQAGLIDLWSEARIGYGSDREAAIRAAIGQAKVAILLLSANFLSDKELIETVVPPLRDRHARNELILIPVLAHSCAWTAHDWLAKLEIFPKDRRPIWSGNAGRVNEQLTELTNYLAEALSLPPEQVVLPEQRPATLDQTNDSVPRRRRVDAAAPTRVVVSKPFDLLVQVRFIDSPSLGLEDWPTRRRPESAEQVSEMVELTHPRDATGRLQDARLEIRVVAPQFMLHGTDRCLLAVPPNEYSKRLLFSLTPQEACEKDERVFSSLSGCTAQYSILGVGAGERRNNCYFCRFSSNSRSKLAGCLGLCATHCHTDCNSRDIDPSHLYTDPCS